MPMWFKKKIVERHHGFKKFISTRKWQILIFRMSLLPAFLPLT